jgi:phage terminase small subunit
MTEKQKRFADEYIIDLNATRAYRAAYPSIKKDSTAGKLGSRMMKNDGVRAYIDERLAELQSAKTADAKEVLEYLTAVLRGETEAEIVVVEGTGDGCSDARRVKKSPDEKERLKAAELLGRRYGIFTDKVKIDGAIPVVIRDDLE